MSQIHPGGIGSGQYQIPMPHADPDCANAKPEVIARSDAINRAAQQILFVINQPLYGPDRLFREHPGRVNGHRQNTCDLAWPKRFSAFRTLCRPHKPFGAQDDSRASKLHTDFYDCVKRRDSNTHLHQSNETFCELF